MKNARRAKGAGLNPLVPCVGVLPEKGDKLTLNLVGRDERGDLWPSNTDHESQ